MADPIGYKRVIRDYFLDFASGCSLQRIGLFVCWMAIACPITGSLVGVSKGGLNWLLGIPVFFALVSSAFHKVSLPFMMYMIPYSRQEREEYIQKMLAVKIGIPILVGCLCDIAALCAGTITLYGSVLQMASIVSVTFISGTMNNSRTSVMLLCYFEGSVMSVLCMLPLSGMVFWIVTGILAVTFFPGMVVAGKHWKQIRSRIADYELAVETEVKVCR